MRKALSSYGVTGRRGRSPKADHRPCKKYFHPVGSTRRQIKARRRRGRR